LFGGNQKWQKQHFSSVHQKPNAFMKEMLYAIEQNDAPKKD